jgi:hypothetical protein
MRRGPLVRRDAKLPFGLIQSVLYSFVPCIGHLSIGAHMEKVAILFTRLGGDDQLNKWWEIPRAFSIRYTVFTQAGVVVGV